MKLKPSKMAMTVILCLAVLVCLANIISSAYIVKPKTVKIDPVIYNYAVAGKTSIDDSTAYYVEKRIQADKERKPISKSIYNWMKDQTDKNIYTFKYRPSFNDY